MELTQEIKEAILNGAYGITRDGHKVKYIGKSTMPTLELTFVKLSNDSINYYDPFKDIHLIFVDEKHFKAIPSTMEDTGHDIIGLWVEPTPKVTLDLPKPFKPKAKETYYTVTAATSYKPLEVRQTYNSSDQIDGDLIEAGLCFKTEQDAQAWVDAFKKAFNEET